MRTHGDKIRIFRLGDSRWWAWECGASWFGYGRLWEDARDGAIRHHKLHHEKIVK